MMSRRLSSASTVYARASGCDVLVSSLSSARARSFRGCDMEVKHDIDLREVGLTKESVLQ